MEKPLVKSNFVYCPRCSAKVKRLVSLDDKGVRRVNAHCDFCHESYVIFGVAP